MVANNNSIPPAGTPGVADGRNPTLIPNFDKPVVGNGSGVGNAGGNMSPQQFLTANPRVDATATAEIGGSVTTGDSVSITVQHPLLPGGILRKTYVTLGGDTVAIIALALADLFNDDAVAQAHDLRVDAVGAILTFRWAGPVGNFAVLVGGLDDDFTITIGGSATATDTINARFSGGALAAPVRVFATITGGQTTTQMATALSNAINADTTLAAAGITASPSGSVVTVTPTPAAGSITTYVWANGPAETGTVANMTATETATIGGTAHTADTVALTFTNAGVAGLPITKTYTVQGGDTLTLIAAGLKALINADATLAAGFITADNTGAVLTVSEPQAIGNSTVLTRTVDGTNVNVATIGGTPANTDTVALTFTNAGVAGWPITKTFNVGALDTTTTIAAGLVALIQGDVALTGKGVSAANTGAAITITQVLNSSANTVLSATIGGGGGATETVTFNPGNGHLTGGSSETVTFGNSGNMSGGIGAPGNTVALTITNPLLTGSPITLTHTVLAGEDATAVATAMRDLVNANAVLTTAGFASTRSAGVQSITWPAAAGPTTFARTSAVVTYTLAGGPTETLVVAGEATETITLTPSTGIMSGGTGAVIAANNFNFAYAGQAQSFFYGQPYVLDFPYITALVNSGEPIV